MQKECSSCGLEKDLSEFRPGKTYRLGVRSQCLLCEREYESKRRGEKGAYYKEYYQKNKETIKDRSRNYHTSNKDKISLKQKEYYQKNKEGWNSYRNREGYLTYMKDYGKKYRETHKEEKKVRDREYFLKNKEKIYAYYNEYRNTEDGKLRKKVYKHRRRVQMKQTDDGTITKESLQGLVESQNYECNLCHIGLDFAKKDFIHLDHIIPLIQDGPHTLSNVQFLCYKCNCSKGGK